jgi:hypothetical protein
VGRCTNVRTTKCGWLKERKGNGESTTFHGRSPKGKSSVKNLYEVSAYVDFT